MCFSKDGRRLFLDFCMNNLPERMAAEEREAVELLPTFSEMPEEMYMRLTLREMLLERDRLILSLAESNPNGQRG